MSKSCFLREKRLKYLYAVRKDEVKGKLRINEMKVMINRVRVS